MSNELIKDMYLNGYSKEFIYHSLNDLYGYSRDYVRTEIRGYEKDIEYRAIRDQIMIELRERYRKDKNYRKVRESGMRYRLFTDDKDLDVIKLIYPHRFR